MTFLVDSPRFILRVKDLLGKILLKLEQVLLHFFRILTQPSVRSHWASNIKAATSPDDFNEKSIFANELSKILLTEKLIRIRFLEPFLTHDFAMKPDFDKMNQHLSLLWKTPFSSSFNFCQRIRHKHFWIQRQLDVTRNSSRDFLAQQKLLLTHNETAFLTPFKPPKSTPARRGASMVLAPLAAV